MEGWKALENDAELLSRFVAMDEWIYFHNPKGKQQHSGSLKLQKPREFYVQKSARKILALVFWDCDHD